MESYSTTSAVMALTRNPLPKFLNLNTYFYWEYV